MGETGGPLVNWGLSAVCPAVLSLVRLDAPDRCSVLTNPGVVVQLQRHTDSSQRLQQDLHATFQSKDQKLWEERKR